jgi:alkaline phosphatase
MRIFLFKKIIARNSTILAIGALTLAAAGCAQAPKAEQAAAAAPKNVIILFADGAASTQWEFGRYSSQILRGQPFATTDTLFKQGTLGLLATTSSNAYITDSAAAGSAMSTGLKVNNGAVAVTPDGRPATTLLERAKAQGKRIGLVTTATIYDATPAAFSIHAKSRRDAQPLVDQYAQLEPDVLMGGGADYFLPKSVAGGKRNDGRDIIAAFQSKGYTVARNTAQLKAASASRILGLFADEDMAFEIDRDPVEEPTTAEMAAAAIKALSMNNDQGFVLLIENENVDSAGHRNDAASLMRALWAFDDAVKLALEFQRANPDTLVLVTGDHETGGFSPTYALKDLSSIASSNRYYVGAAHFKMLDRISISFAKAKEKLGDKITNEALDKLLAAHFPGFSLDTDLREAIINKRPIERNTFYLPENLFGRMVARTAGFYWGTGGHTSEPVVVGAIGPGAERFHGFQDNTDFARHLTRLIDAKERAR